MNNEVYHNNVEQEMQCALHVDDIMEIICKYVNGKDLSKMAKVCKLWRYAALREHGRRYRPLQLPLPYLIDNLASTLRVIPSVSLFFFERRLVEHIIQSHAKSINNFHFELDEKLIRDFKPQLPNETIVMEVDELYHLEVPSGKCGILGMFFPSAEDRVSVRVSWLHHRSANRVAEDLGMNDSDCPKSTIILLFCTRSSMDFAILAGLCRRAQLNGEEITLASIFANSITASNYHTENESNFKSSIGLRISGPSVESWSTFIAFSESQEEIERKLQILKDKVKRKQFYTGLFYAPKYIDYYNYDELQRNHGNVMMRHLERFFPEISFTGFCKKMCKTESSAVDGFDENDIFREQFLCDLFYYASIIIIAYD